MTTAKEFYGLPPHIRRHLAIRYGISEHDEHWFSPEAQASYIRSALEDRQLIGLKYLAATVRDVSFAAHSTSDLIKLLAELPTDDTVPILVSEVIRRLNDLDERHKSQLAETLSQIASDIQQQAPQRIAADRATMRILYRLDFEQAFLIAAICARSSRKIRREASYRFYLNRGVDEAGRNALSEKIWDSSIRYRQVISTDRKIVQRLGLERILVLAPNTYWRMIAVAGMLDIDDPGKVFKICADYPLEIVWAISEKRIVSLAPYIMELLETHRDDAYLLNRICSASHA